MDKNKELVVVTFQMNEEMHYQLKRHCLDSGMTLRTMLNELIKEELVRSGVIKDGEYK